MGLDQALRTPLSTTTAMAGAPLFARVDVYWAADPVLDAWAELEREAACSIYQTRAWLLPWIETLGRRAGITPFYVVARARDERPVALLCLGLVARGPLRVATWLGGKDANFNMPLVRKSDVWPRAEVARLIRDAARAAGARRPDAFLLGNQPFAWDGRANPLALLRHQASPSAAYGTDLAVDAEALFAAKLSKETRKKLRKKESRLAALGEVGHRVAATGAEQAVLIEAFLAQKIDRFRARKIPSLFAAPEMRAFIEAASAPRGAGIELHALTVGERIVAVYGGAAWGGQWSGMFNAFDASDDVAKASPGDLLLMKVIAKACADGLTRFDLGIGEARYKAALCDETIPLFDTMVAMTPQGLIYTAASAMRQRLKRAVKSDARLLAAANALRARLLARV